jgi:hypothetical protein
VGNLSAHALHFAPLKRKRLGASKYSNLIFERFIGVFSLVFFANQKINLVPRAFPFLSLGRREKALAPGGHMTFNTQI